MQVAQFGFAQDIVEDDGDFLELGRGECGVWLFIFPSEGFLNRELASFSPYRAARLHAHKR